jgi:hypothetical protein
VASTNGRNPDPSIRQVLEEIRALRREAQVDRREAREERRRADAAAENDRRQAEIDRRQAEIDRRRFEADRVRSDERFAQLIREFREDSARREAATQKAFRDIRTVGLSIVKTLNRHTRLLERIDHKLGARGNGRPENGRGR